jgi:hypothetical protein
MTKEMDLVIAYEKKQGRNLVDVSGKRARLYIYF